MLTSLHSRTLLASACEAGLPCRSTSLKRSNLARSGRLCTTTLVSLDDSNRAHKLTMEAQLTTISVQHPFITVNTRKMSTLDILLALLHTNPTLLR